MEVFKAHPYIISLLEGAKLREYESHLLSDGGKIKMDRLYSDGVLLCGEAGGFNSSSWTGVPPAMLSGLKAAEAVALAKSRKRYDAETLSCYKDLLYETGLPRMLYRAKWTSDFLEDKARTHMEGFMGNLFELVVDSFMEEINFTTPEPFPVVRKAYDRLIADYMPALLKTPADKLVGLVDRLVSWWKKRKIRRSACWPIKR